MYRDVKENFWYKIFKKYKICFVISYLSISKYQHKKSPKKIQPLPIPQ